MRYFLLLLLTIASFSFLAPPSSAQTSSSGITVTPQLMRLDLAEDSTEYVLTYENLTKHSVVLTFSAQDFTELEDGWKIKFLEPKDAQNYRYSLSSWIVFPTRTMTLGPGEKRDVKVEIEANELSSGGHYASILAEVEQGDSSENVTLRGILSSLLFVRASTGRELEEASIVSLSPSQDLFSFPHQFTFRFNNSGNVELVPYGTLEIFDPLGKLVVKAAVNEESLITLPESIRRYSVTSNETEGVLLPGLYNARLNLIYGTSNKTVSRNVSFFSLGSVTYLSFSPVLLSFMLLIFVMRRRRAKKTKVVSPKK